MFHGTVGASTRAHVAENHECRGAVVPALADVGTASLFADGVEAHLAHEGFQAEIVRRTRRSNLQPCRLRLALLDFRERDDVTHRSINYIETF